MIINPLQIDQKIRPHGWHDRSKSYSSARRIFQTFSLAAAYLISPQNLHITGLISTNTSQVLKQKIYQKAV